MYRDIDLDESFEQIAQDCGLDPSEYADDSGIGFGRVADVHGYAGYFYDAELPSEADIMTNMGI